MSELLLSQIELFNFKSFRGSHIVGPFSDFTAIIGPNGTGKSNLVDAISFALGSKSNELRSNDLGRLVSNDPIPNNIDPNLNACVKLHFRSRNTQFSPNSMVFTRSITKPNNSNVYSVDGSVCSRQQYFDQLTELGFDVKEKFYLLYQNKIDNLITTNSKKLTKTFERLSGSDKYQEEYETLKRNFDKVNESNLIINKQRKSLESSIEFVRSMQSQITKKQEILELYNEVKVKKNLFVLYKNDLKKRTIMEQLVNFNMQHDDEQIFKLKEQQDRINEQCDILCKKLKSKKIDYRTFEQSVIFKCNSLCKAAKEKYNQTEKNLNNAKSNFKDVSKQIEVNKLKIKSLEEVIESFERQLIEAQQRKDEVMKKRHQTITDDHIQEYYRLKKQFEKSNYSKAHTDSEEIIKSNQTKANFIESERFSKKKEIKSLEEKIARNELEIKNESEKLRLLNNDHKDKLDELNREKLTVMKRIEKLDEQIKKCKPLLDELYANKKKKVETKDINYFVDRLQQTYGEDMVIGPFSEIFHVKQEIYEKAFSSIAFSYQNTIIVLLLKTLETIRNSESKESLVSKKFLSLESVIKRFKPHHLPEILIEKHGSDVHFGFLSTKIEINSNRKNLPALKKALEVLFGNIIVCSSRTIAKDIAFNQSYPKFGLNSITLDGTYYKRNGIISANYFAIQRGSSRLNYESEMKKIKQFEAEKLSEEKKFAEISKKVLYINGLNAEHEQLCNLEEECSHYRLAITKLQEELEVLNQRLFEHNTIITKTKSEMELIEKNQKLMFNDFLSRIGNFDTIEDFEDLLLKTVEENQIQIDQIEKNMKEQKLLLNNLNLTSTQLSKQYSSWQDKVAEFQIELVDHDTDMKTNENELEKAEYEKEKITNLIAQLETEFQNKKEELANINVELDFQCKKQKDNQILNENLNFSLDNLKKDRYEILKNVFIIGLILPIVSENVDFGTLFDRLDKDADRLESVQQIVMDNTLINELIIHVDMDDDTQYNRILDSLNSKLKNYEKQLEELLGGDQQEIVRRISTVSDHIKEKNLQLKEVKKNLNEISVQFADIKNKRKETFIEFMEKVRSNLQKYYKEFTGDQFAQSFIYSENEEEPYLGGTNFSCIIPGKKFQAISNLSGGEKFLAALMLLYSCNSGPSPCFFIMDEIDSPLDNGNIKKLIDFIKKNSPKTQFIMVSHKLQLYSSANSLIGVSKRVDPVGNQLGSKTISFDLTQFNEVDSTLKKSFIFQ